MPFFTCNDIDLYYEVHGEGLPLLLISGLGGGAWSWYGQVPYFEQFYRTIVFDNRGAGRSSMPPGPYSIKGFAEDALCLLDALEVDKAFVVGISMGGMIAQELALMAPERVRGLILGCTNCGGETSISPSQETMQILLNNEGLSHEQIVRKNLPIFLSEECLSNDPETVTTYVKAQIEAPPQPEEAFLAQLAAIRDFDVCDRLVELQMPTLIMSGSRDVLIPRENAYILTQSIAHADLVFLPGAGHAIHAESRGDFNLIIDNFIQQYVNEDEFEETPSL